MFVGLDMEVLATGSLKPENEDEALLMEAWNVTIDVIKRCLTGIIDCHDRGHQWKTLMRWLKSVDEGSHSSSPFSQYIDADTVNRYSKIWAGLIVLCLRSVAEPEKYRVPLSPVHTAILAEMEACRRQGDIGDDGFDFPLEGVWPEETLEDIVLRFSKSIVMYEDWETVGVVPYYCGVLGYNLKSST